MRLCKDLAEKGAGFKGSWVPLSKQFTESENSRAEFKPLQDEINSRIFQQKTNFLPPKETARKNHMKEEGNWGTVYKQQEPNYK